MPRPKDVALLAWLTGERRERTEREFWMSIEMSGACWEWTGERDPQGYGRYSFTDAFGKTRHVQAHRLAWTLTNGPIPDGLLICHTCDNPPCQRGEHHFPGSYADNRHDSDKKGRSAVGERHPFRLNPGLAAHGDRNGSRVHPEMRQRGEASPWAKLTESEVIAIRESAAAGESPQAIAARVGVSLGAVKHVIARRDWRHVAPEIARPKSKGWRNLSDAQVVAIRTQAAERVPHLTIAAQFHVSRALVGLIYLRKLYQHVEGGPPPLAKREAKRKMSAEHVREMRALRGQGVDAKSLAVRYGVSAGHIFNVLAGLKRSDVA